MTESRKKRQSVQLVGETKKTKVYHTCRVIGREVIKKHYFVLKGDHQFTIETRGPDQFEFIRLTKTNKIIGRLKNGQVKTDVADLDKEFFLSKLDLKPRTPPGVEPTSKNYNLSPIPKRRQLQNGAKL